MNDEKIYPTSVRLPASLKAELEEIARKERRALSNLIVVILEKYVEEHKDIS